VALIHRAGAQPASEIQPLLQERLWLISLLTSGCYAYFAISSGLTIFSNARWFYQNWYYFPLFWLVFLVSVAFTTILSTRKPLSLRALRLIESMLIGLVVADRACNAFLDLIVQDGLSALYGLGRTNEEANSLVWFYSAYYTLPFFTLIVAYATLVPSGWRRCTAVVTVAAVTPLTVAVIGALARPDMLSVYVEFLLPMGAFLSVAVSIAIYGSHRLEMLRQEVSEARKLGQYVLKESLGHGGMGEVYLAEHLLLRRPCAIKLIRPERLGDPRMATRFEREVRATATLTHPNTVQIFDYGHAEDGTFYYVMEYLPGLTLQQLVEQYGPLPPARAVYILRQICRALREAHAIGLIHRDIKPSNVMVCERGGQHDRAKLLDFGLVLPLENQGEKLTHEGAIPGTPAYMSPEQAGGQGELDRRSDIYSTGALAYFLLTGLSPFAGRTAIKMLGAHLYEAPVPLTQHRPDVPAGLEGIVLRCLAKDPAARFPDAQGLEEALAGCHIVGHWDEGAATDWWRSQLGSVGRSGLPPGAVPPGAIGDGGSLTPSIHKPSTPA
jgi:serine/threonine-protein kinase